MFNLLTERDYTAFEERYLQTAPEEIDPRMLPVIQEFNKIPGVISIWSCSGHTSEERGEKAPRYQFPSIIFGATKDAEQMFKRFEKWCQTLSVEQWKRLKPKLNCSMLLSTPITSSIELSNPIYPCWGLSIRGDFGKDKTGQETMDQFMMLVKYLQG
jgi:hypothetical protein